MVLDDTRDTRIYRDMSDGGASEFDAKSPETLPQATNDQRTFFSASHSLIKVVFATLHAALEHSLSSHSR